MGFLRLATGALGKGALRTGKLGFNMARGNPIGRAALGAGIGATAGAFTGDYESLNLRLESIGKGALFGAAAGAATWAMPRAARGAWRMNMKAGRSTLRAAERFREANFIGPRLPGGLISPVKEGASSSILGRRLSEFGASPMAHFAGVAGGTGMTLGRGVARAGMFAFEHPGAALMIGGGTVGGLAYLNRGQSSPTMEGASMNVNYNQQMIAAEQLQMGMGAGQFGTGTIGSAPQMMGRMNQAMVQSTVGLTQGLHRGRHG